MDNWKSLNASGVLRYAAGDYEEAERIFREAFSSAPDIPVLGYNLGMSIRAQGRENEAAGLIGTYESLMAKACPYFDGRLLRDRLESVPLSEVDSGSFDALLGRGFRRTGTTMSRNVCENCLECVQMRIDLTRFRPSRSQRRVLARNADLERSVGQPRVDDERIALYERYLRVRHDWGEANYSGDLAESAWAWEGSEEISFRLAGRIVCVGILDRGRDSLYSALCFFDPDMPKRSLGILSLATMALWGRENGFSWLYTGEYLEAKENMRYKKFFGPRQDLADGRWTDAEGSSS